MLKPVRTSPPAETPVSLAEAKAQLGVSDSASDALITALIEAATERLDGWAGILGRALVTQTWAQKFPAFPTGKVFGLALAPVQSITSIAYYDADNALQALAGTVFTLLDDELSPFVTLQSGQTWPGTFAREDAVTVTFVAGYGAASAVPAPIRQAIILMTRELHQFSLQDSRLVREQVPGVGMFEYARSAAGEAASPLPLAADQLISPYRRIGL
jgi:uncharacterized phiE125 gp8 family phage protein